MPEIDEIAITLDTDWAPDWMIEETLSLLVEQNVKATWFITNDSPALKTLRQYNHLMEIGVHPNFFHNSTQGNNENEILHHVKTIVPEASAMRTHGLYQSTLLLMLASREFNLNIDCSLLLPGQSYLKTHVLHSNGDSIIRVPSFWEDDIEMGETTPRFCLKDLINPQPGLKIFNFHPIHVLLNSVTMKPYHDLLKKIQLNKIEPKILNTYMNSKEIGTRTLFTQLIEALAGQGQTVSEIARKSI